MRADNTAHLRDAARRKHEECLSRVTAAIREADRLHHTLTVQGVAKAAGVSPSWIYSQPDVVEAVRTRRDAVDRRSPERRASTKDSGHASQQKRIDLLSTRVRELSGENQNLRRELSVIHAELRRLRQVQPRQTVSEDQRERRE